MPARVTSNIASHLAVMAEQQPDRPAVIFPASRNPSGEVIYTQYTFRELELVSSQIARGLHQLGIKRGTRTALMVPPSLEFFALTFALFKSGIVPVLIDPGIGISNLGKCLGEAQPEAFIGIPKAHAARVLLGWARGTITKCVTVGSKWFWSGHTLEQVKQVGGGSGESMLIDPERDEMSAILFTSGSTGIPKGVVYTHGILSAQVDHIRELYGIEPGELDMPTFPLFALFGPALGMGAVIPEMDPTRPAQVDPDKIITAIKRFNITNMFGSPAVINRVGRHGEAHGIKLPSLRRAISAGAPVPARVLERFAKMLPEGAQVFTPYGATECLPVASIGSDEILKDTRHQTDLGKGVCVGRPLRGVTVKIIRINDAPITTWEDSLELPQGEVGEIAVRADHATRVYFNRPESTALAKIQTTDGGFFHRMGDVGYLDALGRIWFCGRKSHRVETAGGTMFTIPCEAIFNTHTAVFRSALVGVERNGGKEPVICIELETTANGGSQEVIRRELLELASKHPHTQAIKAVLFHPSFPVDIRHNAKIFREKLAVWAAKQV